MLHGLDLYIATRTFHFEHDFTDCRQYGQAVDWYLGADELVRHYKSRLYFGAIVSQLTYLLTYLFPGLPSKKKLTDKFRPRAHQCIINCSVWEFCSVYTIQISNTHIAWYCIVHLLCNECYVRSYFLYMLFLLLWCKSYAHVIGLLNYILIYVLTYSHYFMDVNAVFCRLSLSP